MAVDVVDKAAAGLLVGLAAGAVGMVPVHQRVVEAHAQAFGAGGFHVFLHQVAARTLFGGAVVGELAVEVAETFVVFGGHHHVLLAGQFGELGPVAGGVGLGLEELSLLLVLSHRNALFLHRPFVAPEGTVQAPMDEHAEAGLVPPFHAGFAIGVAGGGRRG